jgi:hypothetical protein
LEELLALLAGGDLPPLREAIDELDREDAGELLLAAVLRVASLEAAAGFGASEAGERDVDESRADDAEELPVADPWVESARPYSSALDNARQLRLALLDQPDMAALVNAHSALTADECAAIVLELAVDELMRRHGHSGGAETHREDRGDG